MKRVTQELFPDGAEYDRAEMWAGLRPMTPTNLPLVGQRRFKNLYPQLRPRPHRLDHVARLGAHYRRPHRRPRAGHPHGRPHGRLKEARPARCLSTLPRPAPTTDRSRRSSLRARRRPRLRARRSASSCWRPTRRWSTSSAPSSDLPGVAFYESRVFNDAEIRPDTLRAIGPRIAPSVELILPGLKLDVVAFGCTSATMTLGEEAVFAEIHKSRPGVACTTPVTAALAAFRALGARSIGLLTPYAPEINASLIAYFRARGIDVAAVATFDRRDDRDAARISVASIEAAIVAPRRSARRRDDLRLLHQPARRRGGGEARAPRRRSGHLQQPRDGLALPAARRRRRPAARLGQAVRTAGLDAHAVTGEGKERAAPAIPRDVADSQRSRHEP